MTQTNLAARSVVTVAAESTAAKVTGVVQGKYYLAYFCLFICLSIGFFSLAEDLLFNSTLVKPSPLVVVAAAKKTIFSYSTKSSRQDKMLLPEVIILKEKEKGKEEEEKEEEKEKEEKEKEEEVMHTKDAPNLAPPSQAARSAATESRVVAPISTESAAALLDLPHSLSLRSCALPAASAALLKCGEFFVSKDEGLVKRNCGIESRSSASERSALTVNRRLEMGKACLKMHPRSAGSDEYNLRAHSRGEDPVKSAHTAMITDRGTLIAHGARVNEAFTDLIASRGLIPKDWRETAGYKGPWIEDYWRGTFLRPHRRILTGVEALERNTAALIRLGATSANLIHHFAEECDGEGNCIECPVSMEMIKELVDRGDHVGGGASACASSSSSPSPTTRLIIVEQPYDAELFHPYVPLFIPWENSADGDVRLRIIALVEELLRPDVMYITVIQRPHGPWLDFDRVELQEVLSRTIIFSAGGAGHIAIPLLATEMPLLDVSSARPLGVAPRIKQPPSSIELDECSDKIRKEERYTLINSLVETFVPGPLSHDEKKDAPILSFIGSSREGARAQALEDVTKLYGSDFQRVEKFPGMSGIDYQVKDWVTIAANASAVLAPRGVGPTSFRFFESFQMGIPPVYIYDGGVWLPYAHPTAKSSSMKSVPMDLSLWPAALPPPPPQNTPHFYEDIAIVMHVDDVFAKLSIEPLLTPYDSDLVWWRARTAIEQVRHSHFTYAGVIKHIENFLSDPWAPETDLMCAPSAVRLP